MSFFTSTSRKMCSTKRILGRRSCPNCGEIFNIYFKPSAKEGICDNCGHELTYRADDNEESLKTRLGDYHALTEPVIGFYHRSWPPQKSGC